MSSGWSQCTTKSDAKPAEPDQNRMNHAVALAELVTYNRGSPRDALVAQVSVMADLTAQHTTWMQQLGTIVTRRDHLTKYND